MDTNKKSRGNKKYLLHPLVHYLVDIVFFLLILVGAVAIFFVVRWLLSHGLSIDKSLTDGISLVISAASFLFPLLPKLRSGYIKIANRLRQIIYLHLRKKGGDHYKRQTVQQTSIINQAITNLMQSQQGVITIDSVSGKGKTSTAVFLIDSIGSNKNLLDLFIRLQKSIIYFDSSIDDRELLIFFGDYYASSDALVIIDNLHRLSASFIKAIAERIISISLSSRMSNTRSLVVLMYKKTSEPDTTEKILNSCFASQQITRDNTKQFKLDDILINTDELKVNSRIDGDHQLLRRILQSNMELVVLHLYQIYYVAKKKDLLGFLLDCLEGRRTDDTLTSHEKILLKVVASIIMTSMYTGHVSLHRTMKNVTILSTAKRGRMPNCKKIFKELIENRFLIPFPLRKGTYIFNEVLGYEYRMSMKCSMLFSLWCHTCAFALYDEQRKATNSSAWLLLIACSIVNIEGIPQESREQLYYACLDNYSPVYMLDALEKEINLAHQKENLFRKELSLLFIKTGRWKNARISLAPYISTLEDENEILALKLQIIEADHGVKDTNNLKELNKIISSTKNTFLELQAKYWKTHILMESGLFSLSAWEEIEAIILAAPQWKSESVYSHLVNRIAADHARTYFLVGEFDADYFDSIVAFFEETRIKSKKKRQADIALLIIVTEAHYIHYNIVYQLGLWGRYVHDHNRIVTRNDSASLEELIYSAISGYDRSIDIYKSEEIKTWRTALIRRHELSLCLPNANFTSILAALDDFDRYSEENELKVFDSYSTCMHGKVLALYALARLADGDISVFTDLIDESLLFFAKSEALCDEYGNIYGKMRAALLTEIVKMVKNTKNIGNSNGKRLFQNSIVFSLQRIQTQYSTNNAFRREDDLINYVCRQFEEPNQATFVLLSSILKYYPIILQ